MNTDRPASGSRWEPPADPADPADPTAMAWSGAPPTARPRRGRARLAAGAAGLLVLGGIGGYWLGHATGTPPAGAGVGTHQHRDRGGLDDGGQAPDDGPAPALGGGTTGGGAAT